MLSGAAKLIRLIQAPKGGTKKHWMSSKQTKPPAKYPTQTSRGLAKSEQHINRC